HERLASIGQLAAGVAHEVGNPLSAISSLVQLSQKTDTPDKLYHNLDLINMHIERITRIVRNLSGFARISNEKEIKTDLIDIIKAAKEIANFDRRSKHVTMRIIPPDDNIVFSIKRDQLMQAFLNIILNALDAVKDIPEPSITITLQKKENKAVIEIADNGAGIEKENIQKIFEPFYTTKPIGKGTGLGLSVTYRIITDMGGEINVESEAGKGATFTIYLLMKN
ncbi:MAG: sensor histidine kinase, partial [Candidatus Zixiibacteriota bacterium]